MEQAPAELWHHGGEFWNGASLLHGPLFDNISARNSEWNLSRTFLQLLEFVGPSGRNSAREFLLFFRSGILARNVRHGDTTWCPFENSFFVCFDFLFVVWSCHFAILCAFKRSCVGARFAQITSCWFQFSISVMVLVTTDSGVRYVSRRGGRDCGTLLSFCRFQSRSIFSLFRTLPPIAHHCHTTTHHHTPPPRAYRLVSVSLLPAQTRAHAHTHSWNE